MVDWKELLFPKAEILFPPRLIPKLRDLRESKEWRDLVDRVSKLPPDDIDRLAFCLMMIRINDCLSCHRENFRYQQGCEVCSIRNIVHYKGTDEDLLRMYRNAQRSIQRYIKQGKLPEERVAA